MSVLCFLPKRFRVPSYALKDWGEREKDWITEEIIDSDFTKEWTKIIYRQLKIQRVISPPY